MSMLIDQIPGHQSLIANWKLMVEQERIPNAMLLIDPQAYGGLPLAQALAQYILCANNPSTKRAQRIAEWTHPDVHVTMPTISRKESNGYSKEFMKDWRQLALAHPYMTIHDWLQHIDAENKQPNITRNECQEIIHSMNLQSFEGGYKVQIIWLAEYLGKEGNRLLKLLEEPPPQTIFILIATSTELILNTILSRCQIYKIPPIPMQDIVTYLTNQDNDISTEQAEQAARIAQGDLNLAIKVAHEAQDNIFEWWSQWLRYAYNDKGGKIVPWIEDWTSKGREWQKQFFRYGLEFLRELALRQMSASLNAPIPAEQDAFMTKFQLFLGPEKLEVLVSWLDESIFAIERNANPKVLMMHLSLQTRILIHQDHVPTNKSMLPHGSMSI